MSSTDSTSDKDNTTLKSLDRGKSQFRFWGYLAFIVAMVLVIFIAKS